MTIIKLPSGRWRSRIWYDGKDQSVAKLLGLRDGATWATKREARDAYDKARGILSKRRHEDDVTVAEWWERWTSQPVYARPKESTNIHNREGTGLFVKRYGRLPLFAVTGRTVAEWREGGSRDWTIPALRAMWNDAMRVELVDRNPFANLRISQTRGNRDVEPPDEEMVWKLIRAAREFAPPGFAAWLQVAAFTGLRPGELDGLKWDCVSFEDAEIHVAEQFSAASRTFTLPKNGKRRYAPLPRYAREALVALPRESEFCFVNGRRAHWMAPARAYYWRTVRARAGYDGTLYLATRHYAGWYMVNVLDLSAAEVAIALGHEDGGRLVELLYGHRDRKRTLSKIVEAYEGRANVVPLRAVEEGA